MLASALVSLSNWNTVVYQETVPEVAPGKSTSLNLRYLSPTGQPVNPGVITQRFHAPTGFTFTGRPVFGYYGTTGGVIAGELEYELYDAGRTLVIRANPHLNTTASDTGSLVYTIPLRAQPNAEPCMVMDGSASIGKHPVPVRLLAKVA